MSGDDEPILEIHDVSKRFCREPRFAAKYAIKDISRDFRGVTYRDYLRPGEFWAVRNVSFQVNRGEVVGLIGHNGAGKSTLTNIVSGILKPTSGYVKINTTKVALMDHSGGLSPKQTGRENIGNILSINGMPPERITACMDEVIAFSDLGEFIESAVGTYSLGMRIRLGFAINSRLRPDLFIVDEALNGGDFAFQMKFKRFLNEYIATGGSILLASHDLFAIQGLCRRVVLMEHGRVHAQGDPVEIVNEYTSLGADKINIWQKPDMAASSAETLLEEGDGKGKAVAVPDFGAAQYSDIVKIDSVVITGLEGADLLPGHPAFITILVESPTEETNIVCGCELGAQDIFPIGTIANGLTEPFNLKVGINVFQCSIEKLTLLPGKHIMTVVVLQRDSGNILGYKGYNDEPIKFEVKNFPNRLINMALYRKNIMFIPAEWKQQE